MAFKSSKELGGAIDPNIYRVEERGPRNRNKPKTRRELYEGELMSLLRKLKPHQSEAYRQAVRIMTSSSASDANVLKASAFINQVYRELLKDLYDGADEDVGEAIQDTTPKFSLVMLDKTGTDN